MMNYLDFIKNYETRLRLKQEFIKCGYFNGSKLEEKPPKRLFKFSGLDKHIVENLKNGCMTLSNPTTFNDIYDSYLHRNSYDSLVSHNSKIKELLSLFGVDYSMPSKEKLLTEAKQEDDLFRYYFTEALVVGCVSENVDSILMWSHYSDKNQGICIEYDFTNSAISPFLYPVVYTSMPFDCTKLSVPDYEEFNIDLGILLSVINKSDLWSYEKEWRIILYVAGYKLLRFPISVPKPVAIYLGTSFLKEYRRNENKKVYEDFFKYVIDNDIPLYKMSCKTLSYELEYIPFDFKELEQF